MLTASLLVNLIIKPLALTGLGIFFFNQTHARSASYQHLLLSCLLASLPLLVLTSTIAPGFSLPIQLPAGHWMLQPAQALMTTRVGLLMLATYIFVALFLVFYLVLGLMGLARISRHGLNAPQQKKIDQLCRLCAINKPVKINESTAIAHPQVWGWREPCILIPHTFNQLSLPEQDLALLHELGHVARNDWISHIFTRLLTAVFWPLLPVWWLAAKQRALAERATDDWVLSIEQRPEDYADLLLTHARSLQQDFPSQALNGSPLFIRIQHLLDRNLDREKRDIQSFFGSLLLCTCMVVIFGLIQPHVLVKTAPQKIFTWHWIEPKFDTVTNNDQTPVNNNPTPDKTLLAPASNPDRPMEQIRVVTHARHDTQIFAHPVQPQVQIGRPDLAGMLPIVLTTPEYPQAALRRNIEGVVSLSFTIDAQGIPHNIQVQQSPHALLSAAAISALQQSRYRAPRLNGLPVQVTGMREDYRFQIQAAPPDN